jgi:hypothetical protein
MGAMSKYRVSFARRGRRNDFDLSALRRREIERHARHVGAGETEDFSRWLIAWVWHNPSAKDQIWSLREAAKRMGGRLTEAEASEIIEEASITRKHRSADNVAKFLGVTYEERQRLRLTTIGSVNVKKRARKEMRKLRARKALAAKRRASGMRARAEYESNSTAAKARAEGVSRMTIYRRKRAAEQAKNKPDVTGVSTAIFLSSDDRPVTGGRKRAAERGRPLKGRTARGKKEDFRLATATTPAADIYGTLPLELRLAALCLPTPEKLARAA